MKLRIATPQIIKLLLGLGLTSLFVYLIASRLDWNLVWQTIRGANIAWLMLCFFPWFASLSLRIFRWWWMLRPHAPELTFRACIWPFLVGTWLNLAIPLRAGDFARAFGFRERLQSPATRVLGTLVVERVFDLLVVVLYFFIGLLGATTANVMPPLFGTIAACVAALALAMLLFLLLGQGLIRRWVRWLAGHPRLARHSMPRRLVVWLDHFFDGISSIRGTSMLVTILFFTLTIWAFEGSVFILAAISLDLTNVSLAPWFAFTTSALAQVIPSAPGFVGTSDYFGALGAVAYGIDWSRATAFIVLVHVLLVLPFCLVFLVYMLMRRRFPGFEALAARPKSPNGQIKLR